MIMDTLTTKRVPIKTPGAKKQPIQKLKTMRDTSPPIETKQETTGMMDLTMVTPINNTLATAGAMTTGEANTARNTMIIITNQNITTRAILTTGTEMNQVVQIRTAVDGAQ